MVKKLEKTKKKKLEKGDWDYISRRRNRQLLYTFLLAMVGVIIFLVGYFLNKRQTSNIFTIVAMLMALPGAKTLVGAIILFPYHDVSKERYEQVKKIVEKQQSTLFSSVVFTSAEKVMNLDFLVVGYGEVLCLFPQKGKKYSPDSKKKELVYIKSYLQNGVANWSDRVSVRIFEEEKAFFKALTGMKRKEVSEEEMQAVLSYLVSLIV